MNRISFKLFDHRYSSLSKGFNKLKCEKKLKLADINDLPAVDLFVATNLKRFGYSANSVR